ncbi:bifunctional 4-hydroxy-2-oxoglutarate aldolase/2-dehydro-3-deoxy-phosphogluconate aldolase [Microcella pacifica]|uniref:Bifunctional 4-hydroxy-2-oxoglutarate aldolase/2-dehydro-3-deoxy-phosphogluconate aldolase n=1 Tax=Microcella pacifica TaxID=2591847 RepID=A0A9E5MJV2_9MICO|nr:bifunctional 4-hydroxy-2-oxoglutarate aldolase/2-dehydro-3-deoxy-phosphogluconate aldolase [Microcella pacifica]NHF62344.1 bifunctional 4-hydroxy-2-oxoglutarate aldolase/2-dehydro-3-deoxy-phosphogluconate aldolase [Microcella pacifica]
MRTDVGLRIAEQRLVAVIRADDWQLAVSAADAVVEGGVRIIEVTCTVPQGDLAIAELRRRYSNGVLVGAGTVTTIDEVKRVADAGAEFLVSPGGTPPLLTALAESGLPFAAGALTPSEIMTANEHGADFVKLFPADVLGVTWLRALRGPFPRVAFIPTGGVSPATVGPWLDAGAVALGTGSGLVPAAALVARDFRTITKNATELVAARDAWRSAVKARST